MLITGIPKSKLGAIMEVHGSLALQGDEKGLNKPKPGRASDLKTSLRSACPFTLQIPARREVGGPRCCLRGRRGRTWATEL